jgi:sec-independent protein translocase protein TatA
MELIVVLVIALLILGPKRLPAAGRSLGRGMREFKDGLGGRDASTNRIEPTPQIAPRAAIAHDTQSSPSTDDTIVAEHPVAAP